MPKLSDIARSLQGSLQGEASFSDVSTDTRTLKRGDLFIALKGPHFNGHQFIAQAEEKGAAAAIISERITTTSLPTLQVPDTRIALGQVAAYHRQQFSIPLLGLTGSCGKTTTKTMLASILNQVAPTLASESSYNNDIGVPLTLLRLKPEHRYAVIEMGANHMGEIAYVTHIAKPTVALITNIAPAHLEGFGSLENTAQAKEEIFQGLTSPGIAILNADDAFCSYWQKNLTQSPIIYFGLKNAADVMATHVRFDAEGYALFDLVTPQGKTTIHLNIMGAHNVMNALAAAAAALSVAAPLTAIKAGLESATPVYRRLVVHKTTQGATIIDDSYNANPLSVRAAIELLAEKPGTKVLALGDMRELGDNAAKYHEEIGREAKRLGIDRLYAYGQLSAHTVNGFGQYGYHFIDQPSLITAIQKELLPDSIILVKGSLSTEMNKVVTALLK